MDALQRVGCVTRNPRTRHSLYIPKGVGMEGGRDVMPLLEERVAVVTGGRDRRGGPLLTFPTSARRDRLKPDDYRRLIHYLINIPPLRNQLSNEK
ncbi:kalirin-like isoform X2 [Cimex lectularius]|uniref:Uncharacterized protein n=1 Tax=Cimex lectularius TaxID=79782 RepID=A0A8I6SMZ4_CIMLE|nr:kalirin-like isoform X2 [Cimex lectularius]XP_024084055.1 kalirin-like isoform X2 [Cimex lectularius]